MSEIKLLPCPFCGGEVTVKDIGEDKNDHYYMVVCNTPTCNCSACFGERGSKKDFIRAWNNRKPIEDMVEQLERKVLESTECKAEAIAEMCGSSASRLGGEIYAYNKAIDIVRGGRE